MLGLTVQQGNSLPGLLAWLSDQRILLILDSCERIVDTVADLARRYRSFASTKLAIFWLRNGFRTKRRF